MKPGAVLAGLGLVVEPSEAKLTLAHFAALRAQVPGGIVALHQQAAGGGWSKKHVTVASDGDTWNWLDGDSPRCAVKPEKLN